MLARPPVVHLVAIVLVAAPAVARAEPAAFATGEVSLGGGHDSNMFLHVSPDAATREPRIEGWFGRASPRLAGGLSAAGWRLDLIYDLDYRGSNAAGSLAMHELELSLALPQLWRMRWTLSGQLGRFDASRYAQDRFEYAGGGLDLRLELTAAFRVQAAYQLQVRRYPGRGERDLVHLGELRLAYRPDPTVEVGVGSSYMALVPASAVVLNDGNFRVLRVGSDLQVVWGALTVMASAWTGTIEVGDTNRNWQVGGGLGLLYRLGKNVDVAALADLTAAPWAPDGVARLYSRRHFGLNLIAHATGRAAARRRPPPHTLRPVAGEDGRIRFRYRAAQASTVEVIGSWNEWATPGVALTPTREPGLWEAVVEVPPGAHRYRMLVDGRAVRPPDAPRYVKDDFDGEDAVIDVSSQPPESR